MASADVMAITKWSNLRSSQIRTPPESELGGVKGALVDACNEYEGERRDLVQQGKREHRGGARTIVSCTCDGERTNRDSESSDDGEYNPSHRVPLSVVDPACCITVKVCLRCDSGHKLRDCS
jgi:hypothetical protein